MAEKREIRLQDLWAAGKSGSMLDDSVKQKRACWFSSRRQFFSCESQPGLIKTDFHVFRTKFPRKVPNFLLTEHFEFTFDFFIT